MNPYAFITGATSGIGLATAKALAASHYDLVLAARNTEKLASVKADIEKESGVKVTTYPLDVQDREAIKEVTTKVLDTFGAPDVLVNDAGLARGLEPYQDTAPEDTMEMIDTNIKGLFLVTRAFLPAMVKENKGHVVNLGSTAGLYAYAGAAVYCATKAAVKTFSDGLRIDVMASDVKITAIQPALWRHHSAKSVSTAIRNVPLLSMQALMRCRQRTSRMSSHSLSAVRSESRSATSSSWLPSRGQASLSARNSGW